MKKWLGMGAVLLLVGVLMLGLSGGLVGEVSPWEALALHYEARNGVAAIVLGARLFDTLLEVLVFALAMVGIRYTLRPLGRWPAPVIPERGVVREMADLLLPVVLLFGVYLAASGHLGPGGGFPAGAIAGTGLLLLALAKGVERLSRELHEGVLEGLEYGVIVLLLALGVGGPLVSIPGGGLLILYNLLIALEVTIGTWVVLHYFAVHRGEL